MKSRLAPPVFILAMLAPLAAWTQTSVSISIGPPVLPVYVQPAVPGEGYIWTPGYWSWSPQDRDYYWVPGTWVMAPAVGFLWTPGYWGFEGGGYRWHLGYWGNNVGFYGGINYGYGYTGYGYQGGRWDRGVFHYNRRVSNVNTTVVHHVYNTTVVNNYNVTHVSFNGGRGGVVARPTAAQRQVQAAKHIGPTPNQVEHEHTALTTPTQRASVNHGAPQVAATPKPSAFAAPGVMHAREKVAAAHERPVAQHDEQPAVRHVQQGSTAEGPATASPPQPHQPRHPPRPQSDAQPDAKAEPHGQERPREEH